MTVIKFKVSDKLFQGYEVDLDLNYYDSIEGIVISKISSDSGHAGLQKMSEGIYNIKGDLDNIINIKVRYTGRLLKARIKLLEDYANVEILDKETGISPGQACVFYSKDDRGDKVLGGGWINKTYNKNLST